jgi:hypothetical protein
MGQLIIIIHTKLAGVFLAETDRTLRAKARLRLGALVVPRPEGRGNVFGVIATSFSSWMGMGKQSWGFNP